MAHDINRLRQNSIFDQYGMSLPSLDMFGGAPAAPAYEEQTPSPPTLGSYDPSYVQRGVEEVANQVEDVQTPVVPRYGVDDDAIKQMMEAIDRIYTPENTARDRFGNLLNSFPERNTPGFGRKFVASMVGLGDPTKGGGIQGAETVMYAPYMRDVAAWKEKAGPFSQAAQQENTANVNERNLASSLVTGISAQRRAEIAAEENRRRTETQARTAERRQEEINRHNLETESQGRIRNDINRFRVENPTWTYDSTGPTVIARHPTDPSKTFDTGLKTGNMTDMEKYMWNTASQIAVKTTPPGVNPASRPPENPNYESVRQQNTMRMLHTTDPLARKWIVDNGDGTYSMAPEPEGAIDNQEWKSVARKVYPNAYAPPPVTGGGGIPRVEGDSSNMTPLPPNYRPGGVQPPTNQSVIPPTQPPTGGGQRLEIVDRKTGKVVGTIPATEEEINFYLRHPTLAVKTPGVQ